MNYPSHILKFIITAFCWLLSLTTIAQTSPGIFKYFGPEESENFRFTTPLRFYEVLCSRTGLHKFSSNFGLARDRGMDLSIPLFSGLDQVNKKIIQNIPGEDSIRSMCETAGKFVFFVSRDNKIYWQSSYDGSWGYAPFKFPSGDTMNLTVSKIWLDEGNVYLGTAGDNFYFIKGGSFIKSLQESQADSSSILKNRDKKQIRHIILEKNASVYCFVQDRADRNILWIGTDKGLFRYNKASGAGENILATDTTSGLGLTITNAEPGNNGIWFSTLEKGMGYYDMKMKSSLFFSYDKKEKNYLFPIKTFCRKSADEFFVAVMDSVPAIFNAITGKYTFIDDPVFTKTSNKTIDIKLDGFGNLFIIKGYGLFYTDFYKASKPFSSFPVDSSSYAPFITDITVAGNVYPYHPDRPQKITLHHDQNSISIDYSIAEFVNNHNVQFAWMMEGYVNEWVILPLTGNVKMPAFINGLLPGKYTFRVKARVGNENWRAREAKLDVVILPPFWQTWWFWTIVITAISLFTYTIVRIRERIVRKQEREKARHEKELLVMESRALRAQMNPHFIFNCMNSIKALIQEGENDRAINYLTVFSRLLRTILIHSDKRQITLYDELETCRLYVQLEAMRFQNKLRYEFSIVENIDLKSVEVPALIIQPFIENAIWHGIMPRPEGGRLNVFVKLRDNDIVCIIDDNGIGRQVSMQNKSDLSPHQSKGMHLTQSRLTLENILNQRGASIKITDKHKNGHPSGTFVEITFKRSDQ